MPNEWDKGIIGDVDNRTEERVDDVLNEFQEDLKQCSLKAGLYHMQYQKRL